MDSFVIHAASSETEVAPCVTGQTGGSPLSSSWLGHTEQGLTRRACSPH